MHELTIWSPAYAGLEELALDRTTGFRSPDLCVGPFSVAEGLPDPPVLQTSSDLRTDAWLLPFTEMFSKRRQFACDHLGRVYLIIGEECWLDLWVRAVQCNAQQCSVNML